jgi:hypothetical protein
MSLPMVRAQAELGRSLIARLANARASAGVPGGSGQRALVQGVLSDDAQRVALATMQVNARDLTFRCLTADVDPALQGDAPVDVYRGDNETAPDLQARLARGGRVDDPRIGITTLQLELA